MSTTEPPATKEAVPTARRPAGSAEDDSGMITEHGAMGSSPSSVPITHSEIEHVEATAAPSSPSNADRGGEGDTGAEDNLFESNPHPIKMSKEDILWKLDAQPTNNMYINGTDPPPWTHDSSTHLIYHLPTT